MTTSHADGAAPKLRWGVVSTARIGRQRFIPGVRAGTEGVVVAIASREPGRAQAVAGELGIPRAHGAYEALLDDPEVDAVYLGLPNGLHPEWTVRAAAAGKHVLCEKPVARRVADATRMVDAARQAGVILMEAFMYRLHPQHARVRQLLQEGVIGDPVFVRATFCFSMDAARRAAGDVRLQAGLDGGALMDVGCYAVNAARFLMDAEPVEVTALQRLDPAFGVDTAFAGLLRFPGDRHAERLALIDGSFDAASTQRYEIAGPSGLIQAQRAFLPGEHAATIDIVSGGQRRSEDVPGSDQYGLEADHFARSVRSGRLLPPAEDGLAQAAAMEALYRSADTGQAVRLR